MKSNATNWKYKFYLLCSTDDSISSTNSSRSTNTVTRATVLNDHQSADDEPVLLRPTRTGRAKPTCYVCIQSLENPSI